MTLPPPAKPSRRSPFSVTLTYPDLIEALERERVAPTITIPQRTRFHPLVAAIAADERARVHERNNPVINEFGMNLSPTSSGTHSNCGVSPALTPRALRLMNTFVREANRRGFKVEGKPEEHRRPVYVNAFGQVLDVKLYEPCVQIPHVRTPDERRYGMGFASRIDLVRSGMLCIQLRDDTGHGIHWELRDTPVATLDTQLNRIFVGVLIAVEKERQFQARRDRFEAEFKAEQLQRAFEAERKRLAEEAVQKEKHRVDNLIETVTRWRQGQDIHAYLTEIQAAFGSRGENIDPASDLGKWIAWADAKAADFCSLPTRSAGSAHKP